MGKKEKKTKNHKVREKKGMQNGSLGEKRNAERKVKEKKGKAKKKFGWIKE